jgi:hypothetical protein
MPNIFKRIRNIWKLSELQVSKIVTTTGSEYSIAKSESVLSKGQLVRPAQIIKMRDPIAEVLKKENGI